MKSNLRVGLLAFFTLSFCSQISAQTDTTEVVVDVDEGRVEGEVEAATDEAVKKIHSPRKATLMSVALPGLGQIYNKKYWKVPIIYGGFAAAGYFLNDNLKQIDRFKNAFQAATDNDPSTQNDTGFSVPQLETLIDQYKTWRDLSYIAIGAIYILNIIDANVDAHLFYFDVSEDLTMNIQPFVTVSNIPTTGLTLSLKL